MKVPLASLILERRRRIKNGCGRSAVGAVTVRKEEAMPSNRHNPAQSGARSVNGDNSTTLAEGFAAVALRPHTRAGLIETVEAVLAFSVRAVGCTHAGICLAQAGGKLSFAGATDSVAESIDQVQLELRKGPVFAALGSTDTIRLPDPGLDAGWPDWSAKAADLELCSALFLQLRAGGRPIGVLSLYSTRPDAFGDHDVAIAQILAQHASIAVASARNHTNLTQAGDAGELVGQALGILMERYAISNDQAFSILRRYSQDHNTKLREVALQLTATRQLPGHHTQRRVSRVARSSSGPTPS